jgi:hypothetical protein
VERVLRPRRAGLDQTWGSDPVTYAAQYGSVIDWVGPTGVILNDPAALEKNVLVKRAGEWRILLHQQTLVAS